MKNKSKLAFDMLELEMEVFGKEEQRGVLGGIGSTGYNDGGTHCDGDICVMNGTTFVWSEAFNGWTCQLDEVVVNADGSTGNDPYGYNQATNFSGYTPYQIIDILNSAGGITTNWTSAAADILKLETSMFTVASRSFGVVDIVLNANEMRNQGFNWTDAGQIALGGALLVPGLNAGVVVAGGIILLSWEMYEANNP